MAEQKFQVDKEACEKYIPKDSLEAHKILASGMSVGVSISNGTAENAVFVTALSWPINGSISAGQSRGPNKFADSSFNSRAQYTVMKQQVTVAVQHNFGGGVTIAAALGTKAPKLEAGPITVKGKGFQIQMSQHQMSENYDAVQITMSTTT
eukprot:861869_1